MSFKTIKSQDELDKLINEFVETRTQLQNKSKEETTGVSEKLKGIEEFQAPITKLLQTFSIDPISNLPIIDDKTGEKKLINVSQLAQKTIILLNKFKVKEDKINQIFANLKGNIVSNREFLLQLAKIMTDQGAKLSDVSKFMGNLSNSFSEDDDFNEPDIKDLGLDLIEIINITKNDNNTKSSSDELKITKDEINKIKFRNKVLGIDLLENKDINTQTIIEVQKPIDPEKSFKFNLNDSEPKKKTTDEGQKLGDTLQISNIPELKTKGGRSLAEFKKIDDNNNYALFPGKSFEKQAHITNSFFIEKLADTNRRIKTPINKNIKKLLISNPNIRKNENTKTSLIRFINEKLTEDDFRKYKNILINAGFLDINVISKKKKLTRRSIKFQLINGDFDDLLNFSGTKTGKSISLKIGKGQKTRNAYKIDNNGMFGKLFIDTEQLRNFLKLRVFNNNKLIADQVVDKDTFDLLTKRFNPKQNYSEKSILIFRDLVSAAQLPITPTSKKFSLLTQTQMRGFKSPSINKKITGSQIKVFKSNDELIERLALVIGSLEAGNNSQSIKSEISAILSVLTKNKLIDQKSRVSLLNKYVV